MLQELAGGQSIAVAQVHRLSNRTHDINDFLPCLELVTRLSVVSETNGGADIERTAVGRQFA